MKTRLQRINTGNPIGPVKPFVQPKLHVVPANDPLEREADEMADRVLRMPVDGIARACSACQEEESIYRRPNRDGSATAPLAGGFGAELARAGRSGGTTMGAEVRRPLEKAFGADFSAVRIHTGGAAGQLARRISARAFTYGSSVFFGPGEYNPDTSRGKHLLAHELTHVVQQGGSGPRVAAKRKFTPGRPAHDHQPGNWDKVQADAKAKCTKNPLDDNFDSEHNQILCVCAYNSPANVMRISYYYEMMGMPMAKKYLQHYLTGGGGTVKADADLNTMVRQDEGVRRRIGIFLHHGTDKGHFFLRQSDYDVDNFKYSFGGIDRFEYEVDRAAGTVDLWFKDRYDFHPVGFGYTKKGKGDEGTRKTNCVHAAAVELKDPAYGTAADFWIEAETTVPLSLIPDPATTPREDNDLAVSLPAKDEESQDSMSAMSDYGSWPLG